MCMATNQSPSFIFKAQLNMMEDRRWLVRLPYTAALILINAALKIVKITFLFTCKQDCIGFAYIFSTKYTFLTYVLHSYLGCICSSLCSTHPPPLKPSTVTAGGGGSSPDTCCHILKMARLCGALLVQPRHSICEWRNCKSRLPLQQTAWNSQWTVRALMPS